MGDSNPTSSSTNRRRFLKSATAAGFLTGLAGCTGGDDGGGSSGPLKMGAVVPMSGTYAFSGKEVRQSINMAIDDVGGSVAGREIELVTADSETAPDAAVPKTQDMIRNENIDLLLGGISSAVSAAQIDIIDREKILFAPLSTGAQSTGENCSKYLFHYTAHSYMAPLPPAIGYDQGIWDNFFLLYPDYAGTRLNADVTKSFLIERGASIAGRTSHPLGNDDFSAQISEIRNSGADVVYHFSGGTDLRTFVRQSNSAGLDVDIIINMGNPSQPRDIGLEDFAGTYIGTSWGNTTENAKDFTKALIDKHQRYPAYWDESAYQSARELFYAVEQAGGESGADALYEQLSGRQFDWIKPAKWRECNNKALHEMFLQRAKEPSNMESDFDLFETVGSMPANGNVPSCEERNCKF